MKRICSLFLFVCLLLFVSSASAYVVSHRYLIPDTTCTVEIPNFFFTLSSNATNSEPFIYEYDSNLNAGLEALNSLSGSQTQILAYDQIDASLIISCAVMDSGFENYLENESDSFFDRYASDWADEYYRSYTGEPFTSTQKYRVDHFLNIRCIELQHAKNDKIIFSQDFIFFIKDKIIDLTFRYMNEATLEIDKQIAVDIMNSIQDGYMYYSN